MVWGKPSSSAATLSLPFTASGRNRAVNKKRPRGCGIPGGSNVYGLSIHVSICLKAKERFAGKWSRYFRFLSFPREDGEEDEGRRRRRIKTCCCSVSCQICACCFPGGTESVRQSRHRLSISTSVSENVANNEGLDGE